MPEYSSPHYLSETIPIKHHGIKGMKWGVRRFQKKDGTLTSAGKKRYSDDPIVVAKKGETVNHVSDIPLRSFKRGKTLYISKGKEDLNNYLLTMSLTKGEKDKNMYNTKMTALQDLISPSDKARVSEFVDLYSNNKVSMSKDLAKAKRDTSLINIRSEKSLAKKYQQAKPEKVYKVFAKTLSANPNGQDAYFNRLKEKGYTAWIDDNDTKFNGVGSKNAMAVFDTFKSLKVSEVETYSSKQIDELFDRIMKGR